MWRIEQYECVPHVSCIIKFVSVKFKLRGRVQGGDHLPLVVLLSAVSRVPNRGEAAVPVSPRPALPDFCCHQPDHTTWPHVAVIPVAAVVSWLTRSTLNSRFLAHISTSGGIRHCRTWIEVLVLPAFQPVFYPLLLIENSTHWKENILAVTPCLSVDFGVIPSPWRWRRYALVKCSLCKNLHGRIIISKSCCRKKSIKLNPPSTYNRRFFRFATFNSFRINRNAPVP